MDLTALYQQMHDQIFDPARLPVAVAALLIVCVIGVVTGPLGANAAPLFWRSVDFLFGPLASRLDKTDRTAGDLATRGMVVTLMGAIIGFLAGQFFQTLSTHFPNWRIIDIVALGIIMTAGAGWHALLRLHKAMVGKTQVKGAFRTLAVTTRSNLTIADEFTLTRTGIGMAARLFDKGVVGPVLWYLIAGLPAAFLYATLAALSWRLGKDGFTKGFGAAALALEKLMGFVPNVLAGVLIACAGILTPTAGMTRSLIGLLRGGAGHAPYPQGGAPVTAMAYALKVSLGGAGQDTDGSAIPRNWAGPKGATAKLDAKHLHRAIYITVMAHLLLLAAMLVGIVIDGHGFFS